MTQQPKLNELTTQREIAELVLKKSEQGRLIWYAAEDGGSFHCPINMDLIAVISPVGQVFSEPNWDNFRIEKGNDVIVSWFASFSANGLFGSGTTAPSDLENRIKALYTDLRDSIVADKYNNVLDTLRNL